MAQRTAELLPVPYFHVIFTIPASAAPLGLQNKQVVYDILFRAASQTLLQIAADPKHLGAQIGFFLILHTWGQNLHHHPHLHGVVPGGGLAPDGSRWIPCRQGKNSKKHFFLPVKVLGQLFRGKFLDLLEKAFQRGELSFHGNLKNLNDPQAFKRWLRTTRQINWVVYAEPPFGGPVHVLKYLARYTHRVAISNSRLIDIEGGKVRFHWKDYADGGLQKVMTLDSEEFIRRFLLHVLPKGFVRIRHYGFLANRHRKEKVAHCRQLLGAAEEEQSIGDTKVTVSSDVPANTDAANVCPVCGTGNMVLIEILAPTPGGRILPRRCVPILGFDTS
jgi:hypothetical protein